MSWTDRLNAVVPRLRLDGLIVDVYEWAHWAAEVANPPHRHTYFEVCRVDGGRGRYVVAGRSHEIGGGDLLFTRPGVRHQIISGGSTGIDLSWVAFHLHPDGSAREPEVPELFDAFTRAEVALVRDDGRVGAVWAALRAAAAGPSRRGQRAELTALASGLLLALASAGSGALPAAEPPVDLGARTVRQAVRYIQDNLDRSLRVDELARHVNVSQRQLSRLFTAHLGEPPAAYVQRVRLDRAAALLVRTAAPIKQVAAEVGFPAWCRSRARSPAGTAGRRAGSGQPATCRAYSPRRGRICQTGGRSRQ